MLSFVMRNMSKVPGWSIGRVVYRLALALVALSPVSAWFLATTPLAIGTSTVGEAGPISVVLSEASRAPKQDHQLPQGGRRGGATIALPQSLLCVVDGASVSTEGDYLSNAASYGPLCGARGDLAPAYPALGAFLDLEIVNRSACPEAVETRVDFWLLAVDVSASTVRPLRFKSLLEGTVSHIHLDLYPFVGRSTQLVLVEETSERARACTAVSIRSVRRAERERLIPTGAAIPLKEKFDRLLSTRVGLTNAWGWQDWRRAPIIVRNLAQLEVPYFRPQAFQIPISSLDGCVSDGHSEEANYRRCFAGDTLMDQIDNIVEELYYAGIPILANIQALVLSDKLVRDTTGDYKEPAGLSKLFLFDKSKIYDWDRKSFIGVDNIGTKPLKVWLSETYQYYRYDPRNSDLLIGVTEKVLERYQDAIVAIEPGNELNWQPPSIRSFDRIERDFTKAASVKYFAHFCAFAKAHAKYCILPSMADGVVWQDPSGQPDAYAMLKEFRSVAKQADFANFHLYFEGRNASYERYFGFISSVTARYRSVVGDRRFLITEFGYGPDIRFTAKNDQLVARMRAYLDQNRETVAGASYWFDMGLPWQETTDGHRASATLVPFDPGESFCPHDAYCPLVAACSSTRGSCGDSATVSAWAYRANAMVYSQFASEERARY